MTTLGFNIQVTAENLPLPYWNLSAVTAFFFISLGVNALVTALIVYRIITIYNEIRGLTTAGSNFQASVHGNGRRELNPLISILIESGMITFVGQLAQTMMFRFASDAFPLISGCVVMLYVRASCRLSIWCFNYLLTTQGISMVVVLVRVERGVSYDHNTLMTANSTYSGHSSAPLALKFKPATKVGRPDSSNDAQSSCAQIDTGTLPDSDVVLQNLNYSSVSTNLV